MHITLRELNFLLPCAFITPLKSTMHIPKRAWATVKYPIRNIPMGPGSSFGAAYSIFHTHAASVLMRLFEEISSSVSKFRAIGEMKKCGRSVRAEMENKSMRSKMFCELKFWLNLIGKINEISKLDFSVSMMVLDNETIKILHHNQRLDKCQLSHGILLFSWFTLLEKSLANFHLFSESLPMSTEKSRIKFIQRNKPKNPFQFSPFSPLTWQSSREYFQAFYKHRKR